MTPAAILAQNRIGLPPDRLSLIGSRTPEILAEIETFLA